MGGVRTIWGREGLPREYIVVVPTACRLGLCWHERDASFPRDPSNLSKIRRFMRTGQTYL